MTASTQRVCVLRVHSATLGQTAAVPPESFGLASLAKRFARSDAVEIEGSTRRTSRSAFFYHGIRSRDRRRSAHDRPLRAAAQWSVALVPSGTVYESPPPAPPSARTYAY